MLKFTARNQTVLSLKIEPLYYNGNGLKKICKQTFLKKKLKTTMHILRRGLVGLNVVNLL